MDVGDSVSRPAVPFHDGGAPVSRFRPSPFEHGGTALGWSGALVGLGALVAAAAGACAAGFGEATAIGGVVLFLAAGVVAGLERPEAVGALAVGGMVWVSLGNATQFPGAPIPGTWAVGAAAVGGALMLGGLFAYRGVRRGPSRRGHPA